jgi:hypothetical protein
MQFDHAAIEAEIAKRIVTPHNGQHPTQRRIILDRSPAIRRDKVDAATGQ